MQLRHHLAVAAVLALGLGVGARLVAGTKSNGEAGDQKRAAHALNRLTFGPRPGDVQRVEAIGVDRWIDQQLHPEKINDAAVETRLGEFRTLRMDTRELYANFPPPQFVKAVMNGKMRMPSDPAKRAMYEIQIARLERQQNAKNDVANGDGAGSDQRSDQRRDDRRFARNKMEQMLALPPEQRITQVLKMPAADQLAFASAMEGPQGQAFTEGMTPQQKETLMALNNPQQVIAAELTQAKLLRAIYSERQLQEVMADFWFNHFNVFVGKGQVRYYLTSYERDVIRPHAMGKFEDLLVATAKSPAMMFYLDNWLSEGPQSDAALGIARNGGGRRRSWFGGMSAPPRPRGKKKNSSGLNENYGRELLELHTLSVAGGYTQKDVTEAAKVFTGWTMDGPLKGDGFKFDARMHEPGTKYVLGRKIKQKGEKEGLELLHLLAHDPRTAHFICQKLAMRFVADNPSPALVTRMTQTYLKKDGDIREVLGTLFHSPEFWAPENYRSKVKTPLEFVVSAVRASGAQVDDALPLVRTLNQMGMMPYGMQPPTGYSMKAEAWVNSSALLGRMNFALALTGGRVKGIEADAKQLDQAGGDPQKSLARMEDSLLGGDVTKQTHDTISQQLGKANGNANIAGLILGSPEFQRR